MRSRRESPAVSSSWSALLVSLVVNVVAGIFGGWLRVGAWGVVSLLLLVGVDVGSCVVGG